MTSYKELLKQHAELEQKLKEARESEVAAAVAQVRSIVQTFELTQQDVFPATRARSAAKGSKVAPKYRDLETNATWSGRGKPPRWIQGKDRTDFLIG